MSNEQLIGEEFILEFILASIDLETNTSREHALSFSLSLEWSRARARS